MASAFINTGGKNKSFVLQIILHARRAEIWRSQIKPCQMGKGCLFAGLGHCIHKLRIAAYNGDVSTALCKGHEHSLFWTMYSSRITSLLKDLEKVEKQPIVHLLQGTRRSWAP